MTVTTIVDSTAVRYALFQDDNKHIKFDENYAAEEYRSLKKERDNVYKIFENQNEIKRLREEITKNNISLRKVCKHEDEIRLLEKLTKEKDIKIKILEEEINNIKKK